MLILVTITSIGNSEEPPKIVLASEVLAKIGTGQSVNYNHVIIQGNLSLNQLDLPKKHIDRTLNEIQLFGLSKNLTVVNSAIRINDSVIRGVCNLSSIQFRGSVNFDGSTFNCSAYFNGSQFDDTVHFDGCIFNGDVNFDRSRFYGDAYFPATRFNGDASFQYAKFNEDVYFNDIFRGSSTFGGFTYFCGTEFEGFADFSGSTFNSDTLFIYARFNRTAYFSRGGWPFISYNGSTFKGDVGFFDAKFNGDAYFPDTLFNGDTAFAGTRFEGTAYFDGSKFHETAYFHDSRFSRDAHFEGSKFYGTANFWNSRFNGTAYFGQHPTFVEDSDFPSDTITWLNGTTYFDGSKFHETAYFLNSRFNGEASFTASEFGDGVNFNNAKFNSNTRFDDSQFNSDAIFGSTIFERNISLTRARYNKLYIRWHNIKGCLAYDDTAYMTLLKNFKDLGYFEDYDNCYFQYRKEHRVQPWPSVNNVEQVVRKSLEFFLEWFYGYGTKPLNAFGFSLAIVIIFGGFWSVVGLGGPKDITVPLPGQEKPSHDVLGILGFSIAVFLSGTKLFIDPPAVPIIEGKSRSFLRRAFIFERMLGALFSILFFLALSGTIVR